MKKKAKNYSMYLLCIILIIGYLTVLYVGMHPNVSREYKMYLVDGAISADFGIVYKDGSFSYNLGEHMYFGTTYEEEKSAMRYLGNGWSRENELVWTTGTEAHLFYILDNVDMQTNIKISFYDVFLIADDINADIYMNDVYMGKFQNGTNDFVFSADNLDDGFADIKLVINNPQRPCDLGDSEDSRTLGVQLRSFEMNTVEGVN